MSDEAPRSDTIAIIRRFGDGEDDALNEYLARCKLAWVRMANRFIARLNIDKASLDGEAAVDLAFGELYQKRERDRLSSIHDDDGFRKLMTVRLKRVINDESKRSRAMKRAGEGVSDSTETDVPGRTRTINRARPGRGLRRTDVDLDSLPSHSLSMEDSGHAKHELEDLLDRVESPVLRTIITMRVDGHTRKEIATHIGLTERSIQRKMKIIQQVYSGLRNEL